MNKIGIYSVFVVLLFACCNSNNSKNDSTKEDGKLAKFELANDYYDFGNVQYGEILSHSFKFYNKGDEPLIIKNAETSCGCTVVNYKKEPLAVGDSSFIEIIFDTKGWNGIQYKQISIFTNEREIASNIIVKATIE